jgi:hypothetical protein
MYGRIQDQISLFSKSLYNEIRKKMTENIRQAGNNGRGLHGQLFIWKTICRFAQNLTYSPYNKEKWRKIQ